jgi:hypothetical protein
MPQARNGCSKLATQPPEPDDERHGTWPRERLLEMDQRFRERLERAISLDLERRPVEGPARAA